MRLLARVVAVLVVGHALPTANQVQITVRSFSVSPSPVSIGGTVTYALTVANTGSGTAAGTASFLFPSTGVDSVAPITVPGWSAGSPMNLGGTMLIEFRNEQFAPGQVTLAVSLRVTVNTPGATIRAFGCAMPAGCVTATLRIAGSAPLPSDSSTLIELGGAEVSLDAGPGHDVAFDPVGLRFLVAGNQPEITSGSTRALRGALIDTSGARSGSAIELQDSTASYRPPRVAFSPDIDHTGGYLSLWIEAPGNDQAHYVRTRLVSASGGLKGGLNTLLQLPESNLDPSLAYSPDSRMFLATWSRCQARVCIVTGVRVGLDGQALGDPFQIAEGRSAQTVWNPVAKEFGVAFEDVSAGDISIAWIGNDGMIRGRTVVAPAAFGGSPQLAVNTHSGSYLVLWKWDNSTFGAEVHQAGVVQSRGIVASTLAVPGSVARAVSYNPVSQTFLLVGTESNSPLPFVGPVIVAVELNRHGAPLALPMVLGLGFEPTVMARSDAAEWMVVTRTLNHRLHDKRVATSTRDGGSSLRLGGCATSDPFFAIGGGTCYGGGWLPPGIPAPGSSAVPPPLTCAGPDPFTALGGGTCQNGGWFPPGMPLAPETPQDPPASGGCATPDPFTALGGGICFNGGWRPRS